jgi:hypothetical protein
MALFLWGTCLGSNFQVLRSTGEAGAEQLPVAYKNDDDNFTIDGPNENGPP